MDSTAPLTQGFWLQDGKLCDRAQARLQPLNPAHCVWTVKDWFSNGTTTQVGMRVNPGDVQGVDEWDRRDECVQYLAWLTKVPPFYAALIEGHDGVLRSLADDAIAVSAPLQTRPAAPLGELLVIPLREG